MKNNRPTIKSLQHEIELLKAERLLENNRKTNSSPNAQDIKHSYIKNLFQQSSMFYLWLLTGILGYATKIPFIGRIITLFGVWYGRTTWWKILVKIRKLFVIFNALLGVLVVFNTVGFSSDNLIAGFSAMGHTYLEIFINFTKRLYNWIYDFFDNKIIPGGSSSTGSPSKLIPINNGKSWGYFNPLSSSPSKLVGESTPNLLQDFSLRKLYNNPGININIDPSPWYKDLSTWAWIGGTLALAGITYFGYKFLTDPTFIASLFPATVVPGSGNPNIGPTSPGTDGSTTPTNISNAAATVSSSLVKGISNSIKKLNPLYWLPVSGGEPSVQERMFNMNQTSHNYDNRYYPFTEVHPYDSWYERLRVSIIGESSYERAVRLRMKDQIVNNFFVPTLKASAQVTPHISSVGLEPSVWNRLQSLPSTPTLSPLPGLPSANLPILPGQELWDSHVKASNDGIEDFYKNWQERNSGKWLKPRSYANVASSSKIKIEDTNKFSIIELDN